MKKIRNFIESPLLKEIKNARIFKEHEFEFNENRGIIDLMLVYDDHLDIIDYKTKNIDDSEYDKQLKVYYDFVKTIYSRKINLYLYSILDSTYRKIN